MSTSDFGVINFFVGKADAIKKSVEEALAERREKEEQAQLLKSQSILTKEEIKNTKYYKRTSIIAAIVSTIAAFFSILQYFKN